MPPERDPAVRLASPGSPAGFGRRKTCWCLNGRGEIDEVLVGLVGSETFSVVIGDTVSRKLVLILARISASAGKLCFLLCMNLNWLGSGRGGRIAKLASEVTLPLEDSLPSLLESNLLLNG